MSFQALPLHAAPDGAGTSRFFQGSKHFAPPEQRKMTFRAKPVELPRGDRLLSDTGCSTIERHLCQCIVKLFLSQLREGEVGRSRFAPSRRMTTHYEGEQRLIQRFSEILQHDPHVGVLVRSY